MPQIAFPLEVKALEESRGEFEGLASTYGPPPDAMGDIVDVGAFARTLQARSEVKVLLQHADPVGKGRLIDTPSGLLLKAKLTLAAEKAREAYALLKDGVLDALSIGFEAVQSRRDEKGIRHLTEVRLWEVSLVMFPANPAAVVTSVKARTLGEAALYEELRDLSREAKYLLRK